MKEMWTSGRSLDGRNVIDDVDRDAVPNVLFGKEALEGKVAICGDRMSSI